MISGGPGLSARMMSVDDTAADASSPSKYGNVRNAKLRISLVEWKVGQTRETEEREKETAEEEEEEIAGHEKSARIGRR